MFDLEKYEIIDISYTVIPGEDADRPFAIQKALLQDNTFRYDILKTHSHVGTHVEVGAHFYENGKTITDLPLNRFFGSGVLLSMKQMAIDANYCEKYLGNIIQEGDIVVVEPWELGGESKGDIIYKYSKVQVQFLKNKGYLKKLEEFEEF